MSSAIATFKINTAKIRQVESNAIAGLVKMGFAIQGKGQVNAPYETGALKNTIRVEQPKPGTVLVIAGGSAGSKTVAYARRRHYENRLHPGTLRYLERGFNDFVKNYQQFFQGITK